MQPICWAGSTDGGLHRGYWWKNSYKALTRLHNGNEVIGITAACFGPPPHFVFREFSFPTPLTEEEQMVKLAYGVDLVTEHVKIAIGEELDLHRSSRILRPARFLVSDRDWTLDWIGDNSQAAAVEGVAEVNLYVGPNLRRRSSATATSELECVVAASPSRARTDAILQGAVDLITWLITPYPNATGLDASSGAPFVMLQNRIRFILGCLPLRR